MNKIFAAKLRIEAEQKTEVLAFIPTYFEFGTPTTASTTDFATLGKNVFARLGSDNSTGVCINDGGLFCIQANDYDNSEAALKAHFGESSCTDDGSNVRCDSSTFICNAHSDGYVSCYDDSTYDLCDANFNGSFTCH